MDHGTEEAIYRTALSSRSAERLEVTREDWIAAAVIGGLRTGSNDGHRVAEQDRGRDGNPLVDLQGVLGELLVMRLLGELFPTASLDAELLTWGAGGSPNLQLHADATLGEGEESLSLEAKCHLHSDGDPVTGKGRKRLFLINEIAHTRSVARGAAGFLPILTLLASSLAVVGRLVLVEEVADWEVTRPRAGGAPARTIKLEAMCERYFPGMSWPAIRGELVGAPARAAETLLNLARGAARDVEQLRMTGLSFERCTYREALERAHGVAHENAGRWTRG